MIERYHETVDFHAKSVFKRTTSLSREGPARERAMKMFRIHLIPLTPTLSLTGEGESDATSLLGRSQLTVCDGLGSAEMWQITWGRTAADIA
jgi:hypothetical protein